MAFRAKRLLDGAKWDMLPATDGQLGCILRVYREWKLSGDDAFLKEVWEKMVTAMEFSIRTWDQDGDFVLEAQQHNTYDIEFYGTNSLTNSIFFAALAAASEMAAYLGDAERVELWKQGLEKGSAKMDQLLFNGSYYEQRMDEDIDKYKYQYGTGCLADQLLGQELAHVYGLGYVLPQEHVKSAVYEIYKNNFLEQPFVYSDEVWTGIEYQVATHLIYEGYVDEAMDIVHGIRRRYDGKRRSPYNEIECGNHYARSMAAWGLLVALSGYQCDLTKESVTFAPRVDEKDFCCFYSNGKSWGIYKDGEMTALYEV